jgi:hypothetical protein
MLLHAKLILLDKLFLMQLKHISNITQVSNLKSYHFKLYLISDIDKKKVRTNVSNALVTMDDTISEALEEFEEKIKERAKHDKQLCS